MTYGTIKVDTVTFTNAGVDKSVTLSGLVQNPVFSGNVTVTGTLSGVTVTGTTANFTSGNFTNISGGTHTITSGVFAAGSAASPSITFTGDLNTGIYSPGADQVAISTGGSGRLFVDSSGNVAVGSSSSDTTTLRLVPTNTDAVQRALHIGYNGSMSSGANGTYISFGNTTPSTAQLARIAAFYEGGAYSGSLRFYTNTASDGANPTEKVRITSAGLVGVGTSDVQDQLHVEATNGNGIRLSRNSLADNEASDIDFTYRSGATYYWAGKLRGIKRSGGGGDLQFFTSSDGNAEPTTPAVVIDKQGRLAVGTTSPQLSCVISNGGAQGIELTGFNAALGTPLVQYYDRNASAWLDVTHRANSHRFNGPSSEWVRIDSSGRVGIGTSSVDANSKAHIFDSSLSRQLLVQGDANDAAITVNKSGQSFTFGIDASDGNKFKINTGNTVGASDHITIDTSGRLGIGTAGPNRQLEVSGGGDTFIRVNATSGAVKSGIELSYGGTTYAQLYYNNVSPYDVSLLTTSTSSLIFGTNNTERARIDTSGRLLVGTSSALTGTTTQYSKLVHLGNVAGGVSSGILCLGVGDSPGNVLSGYNIGRIFFTDNNAGEFASIVCQADANAGSGDYPGRLVFSVTSDSSASPTEAMRINSGQNLLVGCTSAPNPGATSTASGFAVNGTGNNGYITMKIDGGPCGYFRRDTSDGEVFQFRRGSTNVGSISVTASATAYNTSSDYRLKENVTAVTDGIARLQQLKPSRFNFISDPAKTVDGFLAHEAAEVVPECVTGEKDAVDDDGNPVYQGIDQSKLVPLLTAALQEAVAEIETLKARLTAAGI